MKNTLRIVVMLMAVGLLGGCRVTKFLDESKGERLVVKNKIHVQDPQNLQNRPDVMYTFSTMYKQPVNRSWFFFFKTPVWFHYKFADKNSKFANWINKRLAEQPSLFDHVLTDRTALNFENYMKKRGYFNAKCQPEINFSAKKAKVTYHLKIGKRYTIDTIEYISRDSLMQEWLPKLRAESLLKSGAVLDGTVFDAEKQRVTTALKNRGFANFNANYIEFSGDSAQFKTQVTLEILPFSDTSFHQKYRIGKVAVFTSLVPDYNAVANDTTLEGIYFASASPQFWVKPDRLLAAITLRPGKEYRQSDFDESYRKLIAMGVFRFVALKPSTNPLHADEIDVTVTMAPVKKLSLGWDADINYSNSLVSSNLLGASANISLRNRNLTRGAENMQTNLGYNIEFDLTNPNRFFNSQEFKISNDLVVPRFVDYLHFWHRLRRSTPRFYSLLQDFGQARFNTNFNYLDLFDYYAYFVAHAAYSYQLNPSPERSWAFDHIGVDILLPDTLNRPLWSVLSANEFIRRSFGKQLFTGFVMRAFNYNFYGKSNRSGEIWNLRFASELSGAEQYLAHAFYGSISGNRTPWTVAGLDFSKFAKAELYVSYTRTYRPGLAAAVRFGVAAAVPFGDTRSVPYVKQLFIGGPNSLRAWRVRELGPGSYVNTNALAARPPYYQTGDFLFEFNSELRFNLFWWFKGAIFLEGGNIWTLQKEDPTAGGRENSELRWDSFRNFAIGSGAGLRGDFGYFILRFDVGLKLRRPFLLEGQDNYWLLGKWKSSGFTSPFNFNIAVGYPF